MIKDSGYTKKRLGPGRHVLIASASVTRNKNSIHSLTEIDITEPRRRMKEYYETKWQKLSLTAYIVACLAQSVRAYPEMNSFIKGGNLIMLDEISVSVLVEKEINGEKIPEPVVIRNAGMKTTREISSEIRRAKMHKSDAIGSLSNGNWINLIPKFLLKTFVRIADQNISIAKKYGKIAVTAVGMFGREPFWFIPHGSGTLLITVGSISNKVVITDGKPESREFLSITATFDHDIIDGAPAARFMNGFIETVRDGNLLQ